jgi:hypothetical protein
MRSTTTKALCATALAAVIAGCGGGGGGGGGGLPFAVVPQTPAESEAKLSVEVDGSAASPDSAGKYQVAPGQLVTVKSSDGSEITWTGDSRSGVAQRVEVDTSGSQWLSRFKNPNATGGAEFKLTASASGNRRKELSFSVGTGDYRNGRYTVYAANGSRQTLAIDFDKATYTLTDTAGDASSGTLTAGASRDGDWKVQSSRSTSKVLALRGLGDNIVGALPFAVGYTSPTAYAPFPFIASRALLLQQGKLDGTYDRGRIDFSPAGGQSAIAQIQISGGGKVMKQCLNLVIYKIEQCPSADVSVSNIEPDPQQPGVWTMKSAVDGTLFGRFALADFGGEKIYLSAGPSPTTNTQVLAVGVPAASGYADFSSKGWSTGGTADVVVAAGSTYSLTGTDGAATAQADLALAVQPSFGPTGMRTATKGSSVYFAMRSKQLELLIGARTPSLNAGFLHLGLVD